MKIKIIRCTEKFYWYQDYIGEIVDVVVDEHDPYYYNCIGDRPKDFGEITKDSIFMIKISDTIIFDRNKKIQKILKNVNKNHKM